MTIEDTNEDTLLQTAEEQKQPHSLTVNLMMLGYTRVGKTFFLGSLEKLSRIMGARGISLQAQNYVDERPLVKIYDAMKTTDGKNPIQTTIGIENRAMSLQRGVKDICAVNLYDIEGQAIQPGRNVAVASEIRDFAKDQHGIFLAIKCPRTDQEADVGLRELAQLLNFVKTALEEEYNKPLVLLLTQIDRCEELLRIEDDVVTMRSSAERAQITNGAVEDLLSSSPVARIVEGFRQTIIDDDRDIPHRVIPCTSLGIGNIVRSNMNQANYLSSLEFFTPYGTNAAFLWAIYARFSVDPDFVSKSFMKLHGSGQDLKRGILEKLKSLHENGEAFYGSSRPWDLSSISEIYMFKRIGNG